MERTYEKVSKKRQFCQVLHHKNKDKKHIMNAIIFYLLSSSRSIHIKEFFHGVKPTFKFDTTTII